MSDIRCWMEKVITDDLPNLSQVKFEQEFIMYSTTHRSVHLTTKADDDLLSLKCENVRPRR